MKGTPFPASFCGLRTGLIGGLCCFLTACFVPNTATAENKPFVYTTCNYQDNDSIIRIPAHITAIPEKAFAGLTNVKHIEIPSNSRLRSIGDYAFWQCSGLEEINLPAALTTLGECCFQECSSLQAITLPAKITSLPRYCFAWCDKLTTVKLPTNLTTIHRHAFAYCTSLSDITLPAKLRHIGLCVFSFCESLTQIRIPDSVTQIESYSFSECSSLTEVRLPANNHILGELIFSGCKNLQLICQPSATPPEIECNSFLFEPDETELYRRCQLVVKSNSIPLYRKAHGWNKFQNIVSQ